MKLLNKIEKISFVASTFLWNCSLATTTPLLYYPLVDAKVALLPVWPCWDEADWSVRSWVWNTFLRCEQLVSYAAYYLNGLSYFFTCDGGTTFLVMSTSDDCVCWAHSFNWLTSIVVMIYLLWNCSNRVYSKNL